jgi:glycogen debranching enzyme
VPYRKDVWQPSLHDLLVSVQAPTQVWCAEDGQIRRSGAQGVFHADVRVLASSVVTVEGVEPEPVMASDAVAGTVVAVGLVRQLDDPGADPTFRIDRRREVRAGHVAETLRVSNAGAVSINATVRVALAADLAPIQAVKSGRVGELVAARAEGSGLRWVGHDVEVDVVGADAEMDLADPTRPVLSWLVKLEPNQQVELAWELTVHDRGAVVVAPPGDAGHWGRVTVTADDRRLAPLVATSIADLAGLRLSAPGEPGFGFLAAGAPWYLTLFGRDSLWAARMLLPLGTELAGSTLRTLAARQGVRVDPDTSEEPGKILHELRRGEFELEGGRSGSGKITLPPAYYGSVDATPLWILLLHDAWCWGLPADQVAPLLPNLEAALSWMSDHGDADGDGLLEYVDTTGRGLANQGWKDSGDSVQWHDGRLATAPIALAEVQAYAYEAAISGAHLLDAFDRPGAARWRRWAGELAVRFRETFWVDDGDGRYPAIALDADKRAVDSLTSNIGHLLGTGLLDPEESALVAARIGDPTMSSGYGLRTLSTAAAGYWPLRYHGGSVWAHDTAIAVSGLARDGHAASAGTLAEALVSAAAAFGFRFPELYSGDASGTVPRPVPYPASCRPQAWSAASAVSVIASTLGLRPDVPAGTLQVVPLAPSPFGAMQISGLRLAGHDLAVEVDASGAVTSVTEVPGIEVT